MSADGECQKASSDMSLAGSLFTIANDRCYLCRSRTPNDHLPNLVPDYDPQILNRLIGNDEILAAAIGPK